MKKSVLLLLTLLLPQLTWAYYIVGQAIDQIDSSPLSMATVSLMKDSTLISQTTANEKGYFYFADVVDLDVIVGVKYLGYTAQHVAVSGNGENVDLGYVALMEKTTKLEEVTVFGSSVIEKADRYLIIPSVEELNRSSESVGLLNNLMIKMPGLQVNTMLQTVTVEGRTPIFQINGKEEPMHKVQSLNPKNVLRIEYRNTPDIRYADRGASGIINFVTRPSSEGGSVMVNLNGSPMTGFFNGLVTGTYHHKKSELSFTYSNSWRDYDNQYRGTEEEYIGRDEVIKRCQVALPSSMSYFSNSFSLDFTHMYDAQTMFSASAQLSLFDSENKLHQRVYEQTGDLSQEFNKTNANKTNSYSPSVGMYFRKQLGKKHLIEVNAAANMSEGDYGRSMHYLYDDSTQYNQLNETENHSWRAGVEALYTRYYQNVTMRYGVNYDHSFRRNDYVENGGDESESNLNRDNVYFYGDAAGKWKRFGYSVGVGAKYYRSDDDVRSRSYIRAKSTVTLNYKLAKRWSLNYLFMYDPTLPSLSMLSDQVKTIDNIFVSVGNLNVKPSTWHRNRLYLRYQSETFNATLWGSYSRTDNPIVSAVSYISDPTSPYYNMFMRRTENGEFDDLVNVQLNLGYHKLFNHVSLFAELGYDGYQFVGPGYDGQERKIYANASAQVYWGNWTVQARFEIAPRYSLSGNTMSRGERFNVLGVQYKLNNWFFSCLIANPFTRHGSEWSSETISDVNPNRTSGYIKNNANMVSLGVIYRANFGKSFKKSKRGLGSSSIDTGVDVNY